MEEINCLFPLNPRYVLLVIHPTFNEHVLFVKHCFGCRGFIISLLLDCTAKLFFGGLKNNNNSGALPYIQANYGIWPIMRFGKYIHMCVY